MKYFVIIVSMVLNCSNFLFSAEPPLGLKMKGESSQYRVGNSPLVQVEIINRSKHVIYIDYGEFNVFSSVVYDDKDNRVPRMIIASRNTANSDGAISKDYIAKNTLAIKPGHSLIRVIKMEELKKAGKAQMHIVLTLFASKTISMKDDEWERIPLSTSAVINIVP